MATQRNTLPGYTSIKPYRQGNLSAFCGLYAALNAARILCPDKANDSAFWTDIYNIAVSNLSARRSLKNGLSDGLTYDSWKVLQLAIYEELSRRLDCSLRMRPLVRRPHRRKIDPANSIETAIDTGRAVLCALCGTLDHYTVIAGYTPARWLLHDSSGIRWINRASTSIGASEGKRHWIPFTSVVLLRRVEKRA